MHASMGTLRRIFGRRTGTRASRRTLLRKLYPVIGLADPTNKVEMDIYADFTLSDVFTSWVSYSR